MTTSRLHLAMLSVVGVTYLAQALTMYTANDTSLVGDTSLSSRGYSGDNDALLAGRRLDAMPSGNVTQEDYQLVPRDVWNPKITSPRSSTVWVAGTTVKVTWLVPCGCHRWLHRSPSQGYE